MTESSVGESESRCRFVKPEMKTRTSTILFPRIGSLGRERAGCTSECQEQATTASCWILKDKQ